MEEKGSGANGIELGDEVGKRLIQAGAQELLRKIRQALSN